MIVRASILFLALLMSAAAPASAERRVALVIGNSDYQVAVKLPNTRIDAESMTRMLTGQGFTVIAGLNLTQQRMADKLAEFATAASDSDVALFFYAGHAIQVAGRNLLVPVEADIKSEIHANAQTIDMEQVMHAAMSTAKVKIVLLDACRDNPFAEPLKRSMGATRSVAVGSKGLAEMKPGEGSLIAFATGPGQAALDGRTGGNSPFTKSLLTHLAAPGLEIRHALTQARAQVKSETNNQQVPWENTNLTGFLYLNKDGSGPAQVAALTPAATPMAARADAPPAGSGGNKSDEQRMWDSAESLNTAPGFQAYLEKYPFGHYATMANAKLAALSTPRSVGTGAPVTASGDATQITEDALELDRSDWRNVQQRLVYAGHSVKVDGKVGDGTRDAIKDWQKSQKLASTGFLNKSQYDAIRAIPAPSGTTASAGGSGKVAKRSGDDDDDEKPRKRSYSSGSSGGSRSQQSSGSGPSVSSQQVLQGVLAIGAGVAIGRAIRR